MINATRLLYPSNLYDVNTSVITIATDPQKLLGMNMRRIYMSVKNIGPGVAVNPRMLIGQTGNGGFVAANSATGEFEIFWDWHKVLCGFELYATGFGIGTIFSVTEVWYNPLATGVADHASRKFESTQSKIANTMASRSRSNSSFFSKFWRKAK